MGSVSVVVLELRLAREQRLEEEAERERRGNEIVSAWDVLLEGPPGDMRGRGG
jgi:hypothetical protein